MLSYISSHLVLNLGVKHGKKYQNIFLLKKLLYEFLERWNIFSYYNQEAEIISLNLATRSAIGGWVEKRRIKTPAFSLRGVEI